MSRTYRRTYKGKKKTYISPYNQYDLYGGSRFGYSFSPDPKAAEWYKKYPHRMEDIDDYFHWMTTPSWWNTFYHHRPRRRREKQLCHNIKYNKVDHENVTWPDGKKPHIYYW